MKKAVSVILLLAMVLSMVGCSGDVSEPKINKEELEKRRAEAIGTFRDFIVDNGENFAGASVYQKDTDIKDTSLMIIAQGDVLTLSLTHKLGQMETETTSSEQMTGLYLTGYKEQKEQLYYAFQTNSVTAGKIEMSVSGGFDLDPYVFTPNSEINIINFKGSKGNENAEVTEEYMYSFKDGLNTLLELFADVLDENNLDLTLKDFGLVEYEIDENRASSIRDEVWAKDEEEKKPVEPVEPAPVNVNIGRIEINSAGTPEVYIQFENTGDTDIVALDFYIRCYDAYGDLIKGYGRYDAYQGTHQEGIPAGRKSASDMYWQLFGFENTKTIEIAIIKYKLDGKPVVEIPNTQLEWIK